MTALAQPSLDRYDEWAAMVGEFDGEHLAGSGFWGDHQPVLSPTGYADWVSYLETEGDETVPAFEGRVKSSYFWIVDEAGAWVGFLALRRSLNDFLLEEGGHIGYSVRPSRRREGHASAALRLALPEGAALGIERVLVTCDDDNHGSRRTFEACGGILEDIRGVKRRYWIDTRRRP
jgi:predicted acetyltransferase